MTDQDRQILAALDLPNPNWRLIAPGIGMSVPAMLQRALRLLEDPDVEREHPALVRRWRRILAARRVR